MVTRKVYLLLKAISVIDVAKAFLCVCQKKIILTIQNTITFIIFRSRNYSY